MIFASAEKPSCAYLSTSAAAEMHRDELWEEDEASVASITGPQKWEETTIAILPE